MKILPMVCVLMVAALAVPAPAQVAAAHFRKGGGRVERRRAAGDGHGKEPGDRRHAGGHNRRSGQLSGTVPRDRAA